MATFKAPSVSMLNRSVYGVIMGLYRYYVMLFGGIYIYINTIYCSYEILLKKT